MTEDWGHNDRRPLDAEAYREVLRRLSTIDPLDRHKQIALLLPYLNRILATLEGHLGEEGLERAKLLAILADWDDAIVAKNAGAGYYLDDLRAALDTRRERHGGRLDLPHPRADVSRDGPMFSVGRLGGGGDGRAAARADRCRPAGEGVRRTNCTNLTKFGDADDCEVAMGEWCGADDLGYHWGDGPTGRDLDLAVAREVLGLAIRREPSEGGRSDEGEMTIHTVVGADDVLIPHLPRYRSTQPRADDDVMRLLLPSYGRDPLAALALADHVRGLGFDLRLVCPANRPAQAAFVAGGETPIRAAADREGPGGGVAEAICRAALLVARRARATPPPSGPTPDRADPRAVAIGLIDDEGHIAHRADLPDSHGLRRHVWSSLARVALGLTPTEYDADPHACDARLWGRADGLTAGDLLVLLALAGPACVRRDHPAEPGVVRPLERLVGALRAFAARHPHPALLALADLLADVAALPEGSCVGVALHAPRPGGDDWWPLAWSGEDYSVLAPGGGHYFVEDEVLALVLHYRRAAICALTGVYVKNPAP